MAKKFIIERLIHVFSNFSIPVHSDKGIDPRGRRNNNILYIQTQAVNLPEVVVSMIAANYKGKSLDILRHGLRSVIVVYQNLNVAFLLMNGKTILEGRVYEWTDVAIVSDTSNDTVSYIIVDPIILQSRLVNRSYLAMATNNYISLNVKDYIREAYALDEHASSVIRDRWDANEWNNRWDNIARWQGLKLSKVIDDLLTDELIYLQNHANYSDQMISTGLSNAYSYHTQRASLFRPTQRRGRSILSRLLNTAFYLLGVNTPNRTYINNVVKEGWPMDFVRWGARSSMSTYQASVTPPNGLSTVHLYNSVDGIRLFIPVSILADDWGARDGRSVYLGFCLLRHGMAQISKADVRFSLKTISEGYNMSVVLDSFVHFNFVPAPDTRSSAKKGLPELVRLAYKLKPLPLPEHSDAYLRRSSNNLILEQFYVANAYISGFNNPNKSNFINDVPAMLSTATDGANLITGAPSNKDGPSWQGFDKVEITKLKEASNQRSDAQKAVDVLGAIAATAVGAVAGPAAAGVVTAAVRFLNN